MKRMAQSSPKILCLALLLLLTGASLPATPLAVITWSGGGGTNNWSEAANWTGGLPGTGDVATFDGTSAKDCTIDAPIDVQGINILAAYTGTITQAGANTITVGIGNLVQAGGTFTGSAAGATIDVNGDFTLSGGTFTSTSGRLEVFGAIASSGGTFDAYGGQVILNNTTNENLTLTAPMAFNDLTVNEGLFGYWKLDELVPPSVDSSGSGSDGTWPNGATPSTDLPPVTFTDLRSLQFDGTNQHVQVPRSYVLEPGNTFTVMCWMKRNGNATETTRWAALFRKAWMNNTGPTWGSYALQLPMNDYSQIAFGTGHAAGIQDLFSPTGTIPDQTWLHVCGVYDPAGAAPQKRLYIDGTMVVSETRTDAIVYDTSSPSGDFFIGVAHPTSGEFFDGWIDEVRLYNRALSDADIASIAAGNRGATFAATTTLAGGPLDVNGTLTINAGRLDSGGQDITVGGSWINNGGAFVPGTQSVTFDGTGALNVVLSNGEVFNNLTINGGAGIWTLLDDLTVNAVLDINAGTSVQLVSDVSAGTITVGAAGTYRNDSTGDIIVGAGGVTNAGSIVLDGGGGGCASPAAGDAIVIRSSAPGTQRPWNGAGTFQVFDVDVIDQAGTTTIQTWSSTDSGNNGANWIFNAGCPAIISSGGSGSGSSCGCSSIGAIPGWGWLAVFALLLIPAFVRRR